MSILSNKEVLWNDQNNQRIFSKAICKGYDQTRPVYVRSVSDSADDRVHKYERDSFAKSRDLSIEDVLLRGLDIEKETGFTNYIYQGYDCTLKEYIDRCKQDVKKLRSIMRNLGFILNRLDVDGRPDGLLFDCSYDVLVVKCNKEMDIKLVGFPSWSFLNEYTVSAFDDVTGE
ncbi:hypothetical protein LINGRAHAP2_LOCUS17710 [Linum grandiflorum]